MPVVQLRVGRQVVNAIDRYLQDVYILQREGWVLDDISALSPHEVEVLAHVARMPDLVNMAIGTSSGEMFRLALAQLEAGRRIAPTLNVQHSEPKHIPVPPTVETRPPSHTGVVLRAWGWWWNAVGRRSKR